MRQPPLAHRAVVRLQLSDGLQSPAGHMLCPCMWRTTARGGRGMHSVCLQGYSAHGAQGWIIACSTSSASPSMGCATIPALRLKPVCAEGSMARA